MTHRKLNLPRGTRHAPVYASHYRLGTATGTAPLLVHVGGAATTRDYLAREFTEPVPVREQLEAAWATDPVDALDVLVCPCPADTEGRGTEWFRDHLWDELVPELGRDPTAEVFAGYSAGAAYAIRAAILDEARAVALLGSAGVEREVRSPDLRSCLAVAQAAGSWSCDVAVFRNEEDDGIPSATLATLLPRPLRGIPRPRGRGGHAFRDYAENGSVAGAFRFLLRALAS